MFDAARLRLTLWYLAILALIVGLLSFALYHILVRFPAPAVPAGPLTLTKLVAILAGIPDQVLAWQIVAVDLGVLVLAALGAYVLAGRTLRPIAEVMARQQRFAAAASHELRTPLTVLQGSMEVALLRRRPPEEYERVLREAVAEVDRMGALVADLLALVRAERDVDALRPAPLDLAELAAEVAEGARPLAARRGQAMELALGVPLPVQGDALKLRQALRNLLDNAVAYTPPGGTIRLVARREHGQALLEVRDSGPGIAHEHLPRLAEPFYRVDPAADRASGHSGLGLPMASWIARAHRGQLRVESRVGLGSTFTLALPLTAAGVLSKRPRSPDAGAESGAPPASR